MTVSRRSFVAAAGSGALAAATPHRAAASAATDIACLLDSSARANAALMKGDVRTYRGLVAYSDDFTLMTPFGGPPTYRRALTEERIDAMSHFFRNGTFAQDFVAGYAAPDLVVLVVIERTNVEVGGLPAQDWALRVTLVYRREQGQWLLAHRHADPLVPPVSVLLAAALARGEARPAG